MESPLTSLGHTFRALEEHVGDVAAGRSSSWRLVVSASAEQEAAQLALLRAATPGRVLQVTVPVGRDDGLTRVVAAVLRELVTRGAPGQPGARPGVAAIVDPLVRGASVFVLGPDLPSLEVYLTPEALDETPAVATRLLATRFVPALSAQLAECPGELVAALVRERCGGPEDAPRLEAVARTLGPRAFLEALGFVASRARVAVLLVLEGAAASLGAALAVAEAVPVRGFAPLIPISRKAWEQQRELLSEGERRIADGRAFGLACAGSGGGAGGPEGMAPAGGPGPIVATVPAGGSVPVVAAPVAGAGAPVAGSPAPDARGPAPVAAGGTGGPVAPGSRGSRPEGARARLSALRSAGPRAPSDETPPFASAVVAPVGLPVRATLAAAVRRAVSSRVARSERGARPWRRTPGAPGVGARAGGRPSHRSGSGASASPAPRPRWRGKLRSAAFAFSPVLCLGAILLLGREPETPRGPAHRVSPVQSVAFRASPPRPVPARPTSLVPPAPPLWPVPPAPAAPVTTATVAAPTALVRGPESRPRRAESAGLGAQDRRAVPAAARNKHVRSLVRQIVATTSGSARIEALERALTQLEPAEQANLLTSFLGVPVGNGPDADAFRCVVEARLSPHLERPGVTPRITQLLAPTQRREERIGALRLLSRGRLPLDPGTTLAVAAVIAQSAGDVALEFEARSLLSASSAYGGMAVSLPWGPVLEQDGAEATGSEEE